MVENWMENLEIVPQEVKRRLTNGEPFLLVDVREPWEHQTAHIEGARLIPLREIPAHADEIQEAGDVVLFCHLGMRSLDAAAWLRSQGVAGAVSMSGGIDRWSSEIDSAVPRY
jgi:rhodanese-related sulfurtransferase